MEFDCSVVDLALDREKVLNLTLNNMHGRNREDRLVALLREINDTTPLLIRLTGFSSDALERMLGEQAKRTIKEVEVKPLPQLVWVLAAIPLHKAHTCWHLVDQLSAVDGVNVQTTVADEKQYANT